MRFLLVCLSLLCLLLGAPSLAADKVVKLSSLDWPPYSGKNLVQGGASVHVVRTALAKMGYKLEVTFFPWQRAMHEAEFNPEIVAFFPEYYSRERAEKYYYSDSIGTSPVGFAERRPGEHEWNTIKDLQKYTIGVVDGYINHDLFDEMRVEGSIATDGAISDLSNLRKVLAGRVDMAVVDINTFRYLVEHDRLLATHSDELGINSRLLTTHDLFVCFKKSPEGRRLRDLLNTGLKRIDIMKVYEKYFEAMHR